MSWFEERVWDIVRAIPPGKVRTYGQVATEAGSPRAAQSVGNAMRKAKETGTDVPWQRVVRAGGFISDGAPGSQGTLLKREGVSFISEDRVNLRMHLWRE